MEPTALQDLIALAQNDLDKFVARYSGYPKNDEHIHKSQTIICGAKKLLEELKNLDKDIGAD